MFADWQMLRGPSGEMTYPGKPSSGFVGVRANSRELG